MVRGEVFRLRAPQRVQGAEQRGSRFVVIVQANELLPLSTVLVAPTSRSAPPRSFRPTIEVAAEQIRVLVEQTTAIAPERLGDSVGHLSATEIRAVDEALELVFGL